MTSLVRSCAILTAVLVPAAVGAGWFAASGNAHDAVVCAVIGGGVCWLAAVVGLAATFFGQRWQSPVQGVLLGMLVRMMLPLAAIVLLPPLGGAFATRGVSLTILLVYLIALALETVLSLRMVPSSPQAPKTT